MKTGKSNLMNPLLYSLPFITVTGHFQVLNRKFSQLPCVTFSISCA